MNPGIRGGPGREGPEPASAGQDSAAPPAPAGSWSYREAFSRHKGLISEREQEVLRDSRVAIVGMGGVGGVHLITLARLGIGAFHIADPDHFEVANFNRQYGATTRTLRQGKATVMGREAQAINPDVRLRVFAETVTADNVGAFLEGVDVLVDGIDFFAIETRRLLFREARQRGIWAVTAGPLGFSTAWQVFSPTGMSFDDYYDLADGMDRLDQLIAFAVGLSPRGTHLAYLDLSQVDPGSGAGPSAGLACHLCSGVVGAEVAKILLGRSPVLAAPWYFQFDAYRQVFRKGRLRFGNRHPLQRLKRWWLRRRFQAHAAGRPAGVGPAGAGRPTPGGGVIRAASTPTATPAVPLAGRVRRGPPGAARSAAGKRKRRRRPRKRGIVRREQGRPS